MKTSEMVLEFLKKEGFLPEVDADDGSIWFKYQMMTYLFMNNDDDEKEFFQLVMPNIYEVTEDNRDMVLEAANKVNKTMKVAKSCIINNDVWLIYEAILDSSPEIEEIMPRALRILQSARTEFYEEIE